MKKRCIRKVWNAKASPLLVVNMNNSRLTEGERDSILLPGRAALDAFRAGKATYRQWLELVTSGHIARSVEDFGVMRGQSEIIFAGLEALEAVSQRAGVTESKWQFLTLRGSEITALADLCAAYSRQMHELTYREYKEAADRAVARVATDGGQIFYTTPKPTDLAKTLGAKATC